MASLDKHFSKHLFILVFPLKIGDIQREDIPGVFMSSIPFQIEWDKSSWMFIIMHIVSFVTHEECSFFFWS